MRIGGLFSGYGGLEMAAQAVFGGAVAWHSEIDQAASKILAHHWPDVPNLGDITTVDWAAVEPVDVLTGGSPCQDVSAAGKRAGMRAGTRSGLWAAMTDAIDALRPPVVVWENVRGVLSAEADSALEPCTGCVGDMDDGAVLRALGRVLGDLSDLGYDCEWHGLRAADIGAPHGRFRVFVVATNAANVGHERRRPAWDGRPGSEDRRGSVADTTRDGRNEGRPEPAGIVGGSDAALSSTSPVADAESHAGRLDDRDRATATDASGARLGQHPRAAPTEEAWSGSSHKSASADRARPNTNWGPYQPAITRWERDLGRVAPPPVEWSESYRKERAKRLARLDRRPVGRRGSLAPRSSLSPAFVEWMMGLPAGHVTAVPGISRNDQLKALGNGVVPQQGAAAIRVCLNRAERAA